MGGIRPEEEDSDIDILEEQKESPKYRIHPKNPKIKLPETIYIESDAGESPWIYLDDLVENLDDGDKEIVGVYELKHFITVKKEIRATITVDG